MTFESLYEAARKGIDQLLIASEAPSQTMATPILTIPRELRDEIYTYLALSDSFKLLLTCRQFNEEGTPLLYKHGIYRVRTPAFPKEQLPPHRKLHLTSIPKIQNLYIYIPPRSSIINYRDLLLKISKRNTARLNRFAGTAIQRRVCHINLEEWDFSESLIAVLGELRGFEVVRVEKTVVSPIDHGPRFWIYEDADENKKRYVWSVEGRLGTALGQPEWESKGTKEWSEDLVGEVLIAEFRPRRTRQ